MVCISRCNTLNEVPIAEGLGLQTEHSGALLFVLV